MDRGYGAKKIEKATDPSLATTSASDEASKGGGGAGGSSGNASDAVGEDTLVRSQVAPRVANEPAADIEVTEGGASDGAPLVRRKPH